MPFESTPSRSTGVQLMKQRLSGMETEEGRHKGLSFKPRQSDVFVVTPPKCGTTWMQQIVHQLRTGGDMEFEEISEVVPWVELAHDTHVDLEAEQKKNPRCYKSHCWYGHVPKGGRYIVIYREPCAVAYSFYNFFKGWIFQAGEVHVDEFINEFFLARGIPKSKMENASYYEHLVSWWKHRDDPNVIFVFFEEMKEDLESVVRAVASFMSIFDEERIRKAVEMSSFEFMKTNETKFDSHLVALHRNKACGIEERALPILVATGSASKGKETLSDNTKTAIQGKWQQVVTPVTGYQTYEEFRVGFRKERPLGY